MNNLRLGATLTLAFMTLSATFNALGQAPLLIYSNNLVNGFQDWSWAPDNLENTSRVHSAPDSISAEAANGEALSFYHNDINTTLYSNLTFWINGGQGGQILQVQGLTNAYDGPVGPTFSMSALPANTWKFIIVPLSSIGVGNVPNFERFWIQNISGTANTFYMDDIELTAKPAPVLTHITVNPAQTVRTVDARMFGINTADWDGYLSDAETEVQLADLGLQFLRFPGGSESDDYHWASNTTDSNTWQWATSFDAFARMATNVHAQVVITANYGTGSAAEAAAWVAHSKKANYNVKYWEVGNEVYGASWETDSNIYPHDPYTYGSRAASYIQQMKAADPTIKVGVVVTTGEDDSSNGYTNHPATNLVTHGVHDGWTPVLMSTLKKLGVQPDFAIYHWYPEYTDSESDPALLQGTGNWSGDSANLRQMILDYYGPSGTNTELLVTENNSNAGQQGKQSTSLVNGLYYADSLAQLMQTEFNSYVWWDLRNGVDLTGNMDPTLYGWRQYGDIGTINGLGNTASNRYPQYYTMKLMKKFARAGDAIVSATSDYAWVSAYASRGTNGALRLLVVNKDPTTTFNVQISLGSFTPDALATVYSYGMPQDNANETGEGSPDIATNSIAAANAFAASFAPYSASVVVFPPAPAVLSAPALAASGQFVLQLSGDIGAPYVIQTSTDLAHWDSIATNFLASSPLEITNHLTPASEVQYWRAVWRP